MCDVYSDDHSQESGMDPLFHLGADAFRLVLHFNSPQQLAKCLMVSRAWRQHADDDTLWKVHCKTLWSKKSYVPVQQLSGSARNAYVRTLEDSARTTISMKELCSFPWRFWFRPYGPEDMVMPLTEVHHFKEDGTYSAGSSNSWNDMGWRWRFKEGRTSLLVQVHSFPALSISRTADWGWRLENSWVVLQADLPLQSRALDLAALLSSLPGAPLGGLPPACSMSTAPGVAAEGASWGRTADCDAAVDAEVVVVELGRVSEWAGCGD